MTTASDIDDEKLIALEFEVRGPAPNYSHEKKVVGVAVGVRGNIAFVLGGCEGASTQIPANWEMAQFLVGALRPYPEDPSGVSEPFDFECPPNWAKQEARRIALKLGAVIGKRVPEKGRQQRIGSYVLSMAGKILKEVGEL